VPIYRRQAAIRLVNLYRRLARSTFLSYISFDSLFLNFKNSTASQTELIAGLIPLSPQHRVQASLANIG